MYLYTYCPDCGYQDTRDTTADITAVEQLSEMGEVVKEVLSPLTGFPIFYFRECPFCKKDKCGTTYIENAKDMSGIVRLRSIIHLEGLLNG